MEISNNISENSTNMVNMDIWCWCPWCGVRQWFNHLYENKYRCKHCRKDLEIINRRKG
jgi:uncharacterized protein (DUF983 family)